MPVEHTGARVDPSWMLQAGAGATRPVTSHRAARGGAAQVWSVALGEEYALTASHDTTVRAWPLERGGRSPATASAPAAPAAAEATPSTQLRDCDCGAGVVLRARRPACIARRSAHCIAALVL